MKSRVVTALAVAAVLSVSAAVFATIPSAGVISGCYTKSGGALRVIDGTVTSCSSKETALNWNVQGIQGGVGAQGPQGIAGPQSRGPQGPTGPTHHSGARPGSVTSYVTALQNGDRPQQLAISIGADSELACGRVIGAGQDGHQRRGVNGTAGPQRGWRRAGITVAPVSRAGGAGLFLLAHFCRRRLACRTAARSVMNCSGQQTALRQTHRDRDRRSQLVTERGLNARFVQRSSRRRHDCRRRL